MNFIFPHRNPTGTLTIFYNRVERQVEEKVLGNQHGQAEREGEKGGRNGFKKYCLIYSSKFFVPQQHKTMSSATPSCFHMASTLTVTQKLLERSVAAKSIAFPHTVCSHNQTRRKHVFRAGTEGTAEEACQHARVRSLFYFKCSSTTST